MLIRGEVCAFRCLTVAENTKWLGGHFSRSACGGEARDQTRQPNHVSNCERHKAPPPMLSGGITAHDRSPDGVESNNSLNPNKFHGERKICSTNPEAAHVHFTSALVCVRFFALSGHPRAPVVC